VNNETVKRNLPFIEKSVFFQQLPKHRPAKILLSQSSEKSHIAYYWAMHQQQANIPCSLRFQA